MIAIKPGLCIEIQGFVGASHKGTIVSVDKPDEYDDETLISAYCTIKFDSGDIYSNMYVKSEDVINCTN